MLGETGAMASITGQLVLSLTVNDPTLSAKWYGELLGMRVLREYVKANGEVGEICLVEPASGLKLCLLDHPEHRGDRFDRFDERRTGLDHLEFLVESRQDLDEWVARLDEFGIAHSGIKEPGYSANAMITFRDPDNIQLEFFWQGEPAAK